VVVYDCTSEGLGVSRVVVPVGIWLALNRGAGWTHFDALASYARGPTVAELKEDVRGIGHLRWTVGLSRPVPEMIVPVLQARAVGIKK
jgi:hypothetical protein